MQELTRRALMSAALAATVPVPASAQARPPGLAAHLAAVRPTAFMVSRDGQRILQDGDVAQVVNVASVAATIAFPASGGYSATKSAVDRLTRVAAMESGKLGYGVRVNCVYPGLVPTAMGQKLAVETSGLGLFESPEAAVGAVIELTPSGRLGEVTDIADAVAFLASDAARFVNGAGLPVDGGMGM